MNEMNKPDTDKNNTDELPQSSDRRQWLKKSLGGAAAAGAGLVAGQSALADTPDPLITTNSRALLLLMVCALKGTMAESLK